MEKKNYIVAIDLGSSNVVVAVAERDAEGRPVVRSIVSKPSQGVKAGMITNIEQVSNSIKAAVETVGEELGIRITEAYTGISGDFVRCARHTDHVFTSDPQNGVNRTDVEALFDRMRNVQAPDDETIMERIPQNYLVDENQEVADPVGSFGKRLASTFNFILCAKTPIERLNLALRRLGLGDQVMIDLGLVQENEYYTGVIFRGYIEGSGDTVVSGGRYDTLLQQFGSPLPATGFGVNVDAVIKGMLDKGQVEPPMLPEALVFAEDGCEAAALDKVRTLTEGGILTEFSLQETRGEALRYARERGIPLVYVVSAGGEDRVEV